MNKRDNFDILNDNVIRSNLYGVEQLPGLPERQLSQNDSKNYLKYMKVDPEIGNQLIGPLKGRCFSEYEDVWEYKYCIGQTIS